MSLKIWVVTIFPELFDAFCSLGVIGKFLNSKESPVSIQLVNLRNYSSFKYKNVDSRAFGGRPGMVLRPDILEKAILDIWGQDGPSQFKVVLPSPRGRVWNHQHAKDFFSNTQEKRFIFICGRYEGIDERFIQQYVNEEISIGDFILSGGELATQMILESAFRFLPGVLGHPQAAIDDSFEDGLLEAPYYTRPKSFNGSLVPEILLSGHHQKIKSFCQQEKLKITEKFRPDLLVEYQSRERRS